MAVDLKVSFFIQRESSFVFFYFPICECWKRVGEKRADVLLVPCVAASRVSVVCSRLDAGWMQVGCFYLVFLPFLHPCLTCMDQEGLFFVPLSFHSFCLDCIFSEAFEADPGPVGLPVKEAGPVYFLAPHHLCGCRVVLLCTCISEAPNKNTLWSACEELLASSVSLASDQRADASVLLGRRIDPATEGSAVCLKALLPRQPFPLVLN